MKDTIYKSIVAIVRSVLTFARWLIGMAITVVFCVPLFLIYTQNSELYIKWQAIIWGISCEEAYRDFYKDSGIP